MFFWFFGVLFCFGDDSHSTGLEFIVILLPQPPSSGTTGVSHHSRLQCVFCWKSPHLRKIWGLTIYFSTVIPLCLWLSCKGTLWILPQSKPSPPFPVPEFDLDPSLPHILSRSFGRKGLCDSCQFLLHARNSVALPAG